MEGYDFKKVTVDEDLCSQYMDGYACFGWRQDENMPTEKTGGKVTLHYKRGRGILNKTELVRLEQHFESCMSEIEKKAPFRAVRRTKASPLGKLAGRSPD